MAGFLNGVMTEFNSPLEAAETLREDFEFMSDWEDRYNHIIDLAKGLSPLSDDEMNEDNKVLGCASQVWLVTEKSDMAGRLKFRGASDAILVSGLIALLLQIYSDQTPAQILKFDAEKFFAEIGIDDALSPQRSNGFKSMLVRIREDARKAL
jgi:cysteine desulfuration protein SufE